MWDILAVTAATAVSAAYSAKQQKKAAMNDDIRSVTGIYDTSRGAPAITRTTSAKCPCCGSRQFVAHQTRRVCSYCRSEQDGQAPMSNYMNRLAADRCTDYFRMTSSYGMSSGRKAR